MAPIHFTLPQQLFHSALTWAIQTRIPAQKVSPLACRSIPSQQPALERKKFPLLTIRPDTQTELIKDPTLSQSTSPSFNPKLKTEKIQTQPKIPVDHTNYPNSNPGGIVPSIYLGHPPTPKYRQFQDPLPFQRSPAPKVMPGKFLLPEILPPISPAGHVE
ncbi:hypothetical protein DSO57_1033629 [Entomophthora muscae]|uniref:Uncharacterized protein n=1 Tax=Entomophthora muscae TaxID=34485 RepID=A0ACC2SPB3_9FUNG|nr:hypothetical protein DSO57_1033629 [Entomophthora muscae]